MKKNLLVSLLLVCSTCVIVLAQDRKITGKIISAEDSSPLPGVSVVLKGTSTGTVTDGNGLYQLSVPAAKGSLVFSFIGMLTKEVELGPAAVIDVQLTTDAKQLSEIVVTGVGVA